MKKRIAVLMALIMMACSEVPNEVLAPDAAFMNDKSMENSCPPPDTARCTNQGTPDSGPETPVDLSKIQFSSCPIANLYWNASNQLELQIIPKGINELPINTEQSCWGGTGVTPSTTGRSININITNITLRDQYNGQNRQYRFELLAGYSWISGPILWAGRASNTNEAQELKFKTLSNVSTQEVYIGFRVLKTENVQFNASSNQYFVINKISLK